ncbi:MAG TPA: hypothetical protein PLS48_12195 [Methanotrichaceae archaeon]|nr:hypothetical protein [Methanotrichaceae archaeon]
MIIYCKEEYYIKVHILLPVLFAISIGTGLAVNVDVGDVEAFKQALENDGFTVQEGGIVHFDAIKVYNLGLLTSALGNNPTTKYLVYFVPPAPGHEIPEQFAKIASALGMSQNLSAFWNLGPDEAVVFVGRTPPECRYFCYDAEMLFTAFRNETSWIWTCLGDPLNNLVIRTAGTPDGQPGNPFNQTTLVITTADMGIDRRIRAAAQSAGYPDNIANTQVIPSTMLNMGLENSSDTFTVFIRPALFKDQQAGEDYINKTPATILRITPNASLQLDPYDVPKLRVRGNGETEFGLLDDLNELRQAILSKYSALNATELPTSRWFTEQYTGLQTGINTWGPNNDACYLWTANQPVTSPMPPFSDLSQYYEFSRNPPITLGNDTNEFIIVYGVNHFATGKCAYSNFAPYGADIWNGVGAIHDTELVGTAEEYLRDNPNAKYLYVYKIARNCEGDPHCFELPYGPGGYGIRVDQPLIISWRLYLENATKVGPAYSEIVYDRAIKFDPKD